MNQNLNLTPSQMNENIFNELFNTFLGDDSIVSMRDHLVQAALYFLKKCFFFLLVKTFIYNCQFVAHIPNLPSDDLLSQEECLKKAELLKAKEIERKSGLFQNKSRPGIKRKITVKPEPYQYKYDCVSKLLYALQQVVLNVL